MKDFFVNIWIIVIIAVVLAGTGLGLGLFFGLRGGAGAHCYKSDWTLAPSVWEVEIEEILVTMRLDSLKMWVEKDTLLPKKMEMEITGTAMSETYSFKMVETDTNSVTGTMWPLAVGNEFTVTTSGTSWFYVDLNGDGDFDDPDELDEGPTSIPSVTSRTVVEAMEEVTVAAGTFNCYKMVDYDDGTIVGISWYSTDVKNFVKSTENGIVTMELQSYSVDADGLGGVADWATGDRWVYSVHMPMDEMGTYDGTVTWTVTGEETI